MSKNGTLLFAEVSSIYYPFTRDCSLYIDYPSLSFFISSFPFSSFLTCCNSNQTISRNIKGNWVRIAVHLILIESDSQRILFCSSWCNQVSCSIVILVAIDVIGIFNFFAWSWSTISLGMIVAAIKSTDWWKERKTDRSTNNGFCLANDRRRSLMRARR